MHKYAEVTAGIVVCMTRVKWGRPSLLGERRYQLSEAHARVTIE